ncbi:MAG: peptidase S74, partial [Terriglobales bacterium]
MRLHSVVVAFLLLVLSTVQLTFAQRPPETPSALPRLVRFNGTVKDINGRPLTGMVGIAFALYSEQTGGAPLWLETQNVQADSSGHYSVLLGATKPDGLPAELFASEQARWIGVQIEQQSEQPRTLLVSAPY